MTTSAPNSMARPRLLSSRNRPSGPSLLDDVGGAVAVAGVGAGGGRDRGGGDGRGLGGRPGDGGAWWWPTVTAVSLVMANEKLLLPAGCRLVSVTRQLTVHVPFGAGTSSATDTVTWSCSSRGSASDWTAPGSPQVMLHLGAGPNGRGEDEGDRSGRDVDGGVGRRDAADEGVVGRRARGTTRMRRPALRSAERGPSGVRGGWTTGSSSSRRTNASHRGLANGLPRANRARRRGTPWVESHRWPRSRSTAATAPADSAR